MTVPAKVGVDDFLAAGGTITDLMHLATRELLRPPDASDYTRGGGGGPESRAQVHNPPELAFDEDILGRLVEDMHGLGHVGEQRASKLLYLALTSRLLTKIVSVAVKGPSGAGKSATVERVLVFVPPDAVVSLTGMSEHFLAYDDRPIKHKMLVLFEAAGMSGENATYLIRTLLSEGVIRHGTVESQDGALHGREVVREGPAGLVTTTTQVSLHPENETRLLSITVDDSAAQTRNVILAIAGQDRAPEPADVDEWHTLQHWLEDGPRDVTVPFARRIAELIPPIAVRLRRDAGTVFALVRAHALLHRATREVTDGRVVATHHDYAVVRELVAAIISDTLGQSVSPATREVVEAVTAILDDGAKYATYAQLAERLKIDRSAANRRGRVAIAGGYLVNQEDRKGKTARLVIGDALPEDVLVLPTVEQITDDLCTCAVGSEPPPPPREWSGNGDDDAAADAAIAARNAFYEND
jgi:hypothetical protein